MPENPAIVSPDPLAVAAVPVDAPASPAAPASAVPAAEPVLVAAEVVAPEKVADPTLTPTLLEKFDAKKAEAAKAAEPAKVEAEVKPDAKATDKPAEKAADPAKDAAKPEEAAKPPAPAKLEPVQYKYTLPETLKMDDAAKAKVHAAFDEFRANPAEGSQKLVDLYNEGMTNLTDQLRRDQISVFNKTKETWDKAWLADPEIGGAGHDTALGAIARTRDLGISSAKVGSARYTADLAEFNQFLAVTGAGSHPAFGRLLHNLARFVDEPQAKDVPANIKPPKNNGRAPKSSIYSHPTSANMDK